MAEKKIGGKTFRVEAMLATEAVMLQACLMRLLGGAVARLPEIMRGRGEGASAEAIAASDAAAVGALTDIFTKVEPAEMVNLLVTIISVAQIKQASGQYVSVDFDREFSGNLKDGYALAVFVLQEQFGDFFRDALANGLRG